MLTKKAPVINDLRGYDGHLITQEIDKFDGEISVIPNGLRKCMAFEINKNFIFIDNIQFLNFSLDLLISHNDSKHWPEEFSGDLVKLVKQKAGHWYEYMNIFEELKKNKYLINLNFWVL